MITLGLDASSRVVGWAFWNGREIVDAGFIDISKMETNKEKAFHVISVLEENPIIKQTEKINLEAALSGFMGGKTSQQTIILLARFNAVLEYIISEHWKIPVNLVSVMTARKSVFGKCRVKGMTGKEYVRQELPKIHSEIIKFEKKNRNDEWDKKNEDMYDSVVIACS
jgi:hypothetical protein